MHPIQVSDTWNNVGIDLIELPFNKNSNQYCITLTDYFPNGQKHVLFQQKRRGMLLLFCTKCFLDMVAPGDCLREGSLQPNDGDGCWKKIKDVSLTEVGKKELLNAKVVK